MKNVTPSLVNDWDLSLKALAAELHAFHQNNLDPKLSETEHRDAFARLKTLIRKARQGVLEFSGVAPDAKVMARAPFVIELRPQPERMQRFKTPARLVRLYCAEPILKDRTILGLHLGTKPSGDDVHGEQNSSIDLAAQRADDWEMVQYSSKLSNGLGGG